MKFSTRLLLSAVVHNLKAARKAYDKAYQELGTVAAGTAFEAPTRALAELDAAQSTAQDAVLALARQDPWPVRTSPVRSPR